MVLMVYQYQNNPLSSSRRAYLLKYLENKLRKNHQFELLPSLLPKIDQLGNADPTRSGEYCRWILDLLLLEDIDLPEDSQKIREVLEVYHRVKARLPIELRRIEQFKSYSQLRTTLLPMLATLKSHAELAKEGSQLLAVASIKDAVYQIYKLTTPEAASEAAKNTGWCVCNIHTAENYLERGPLYLVVRDGGYHALAHLESHQITDVNDINFYPGNKDQNYEDVAELFRQYLPEFICSKPLKDSPLFTHGSLLNVECYTSRCHDVGCPECGFKLCEFEDTSGFVTQRCHQVACPKHLTKCQTCEILLCDDHANFCCQNNAFCQKDLQTCNRCSNTICPSCSSSCEECDKISCEKCSVSCDACSNNYCYYCAKEATCRGCEKIICHKCQEEGLNCGHCDVFYCEECLEDRCEDCGSSACPHCSIKCPSCQRRICSECTSYCRHCEGRKKDTYCVDCSRNICDACNQHVPETQPCYICDEENLCSNCVAECARCGFPICESEQVRCDCEESHIYCSRCSQYNRCLCGQIVCHPEDHFPCAYLMRWRH